MVADDLERPVLDGIGAVLRGRLIGGGIDGLTLTGSDGAQRAGAELRAIVEKARQANAGRLSASSGEAYSLLYDDEGAALSFFLLAIVLGTMVIYLLRFKQKPAHP